MLDHETSKGRDAMVKPMKKTKALVPGVLYKIRYGRILWSDPKETSKSLAVLSKGDIVVFVRHLSSNFNICKVMTKDSTGWIIVNPKYSDKKCSALDYFQLMDKSLDRKETKKNKNEQSKEKEQCQ